MKRVRPAPFLTDGRYTEHWWRTADGHTHMFRWYAYLTYWCRAARRLATR